MADPVIIHWFRRDLRLADNLGLNAALSSGLPVVPLFVFDPVLLRRAGPPRLAFMLRALHALDEALRRQGSRLLVRYGDPRAVLPQVVAEVGASAVTLNRDYSPFARHRDQAVKTALAVPLHTFDDLLLRAPGNVLKDDGTPYTVYTPFKNRWRSLPDPAPPGNGAAPVGRFAALADVANPGLPDSSASAISADVSEQAAAHRLDRFAAERLFRYGSTRNALVSDPFAPDPPEGSSYLSPYLRFGVLSARQVYWAAREALAFAPDSPAHASVETWIDELIWREFYVHILYHFPQVMQGCFRSQYDPLEWRTDPGDLQAWQDGLTGYPVVDAAMRQLRQIGWMPNRARMIVASFLTRDLLIHWQEGERTFMQWLVDGDPAANNGGWQWCAGTGTDAQPYFRIFHPVTQSQKFDPHGDYIRRWVPELCAVPDRFVHEPWQMESPPPDYPPPIVDHAVARERTLAAFRAIRG